jgi:hypothetical protein
MKPYTASAFIFLIILLFFSCSEGLNTIFDNIANDNQITNRSLDDDLYVMAMTKYDPGTGDHYYIACGDIRSRAATGGHWPGVSGFPSGIKNTVAADGTDLYVGIVYDNGTGNLFRLGSPTVPILNPLVVKNVVKVKNTGGIIYAAYQKTDTNKTYSVCDSGGAEVGWVGAMSLTDSIDDFDNNSGTLAIVSGSYVYLGNNTDIAPSPANTYSGIYYVPKVPIADSRFYLATSNGLLYVSTIAAPAAFTDWTPSDVTFKYIKSGRDYDVRFSEFRLIDGSNILLVGTHGSGFYTIDTTLAFQEDVGIVRFKDASKNDLYNGAVESFYVDASVPATPRVFFCTMHAGLWDNTWDIATKTWGPTWTRE